MNDVVLSTARERFMYTHNTKIAMQRRIVTTD